jgi:hypothetical protein
MCPVAHDFDENIRHDLVRKVGVKKAQNNLKKGSNPTFFQLSNTIKTTFLICSRTKQELPIFLSSHPTLNLSILSTVRLIL